jgi:hypothetical protein
MIESILRLAADNLFYAEALVSDIEDAKMATQPGGVKNHPAWTIGHLCVGQDIILQMLEMPSAIDPSWLRLFGPGIPPTDDRLNFPLKVELIAALKAAHEKTAAGVREHFDRRSGAANPIPPLVERFPTVGDLVLYFLTTHEATHLGQISAWRRAMEMPSVSVQKAAPPPASTPAVAPAITGFTVGDTGDDGPAIAPAAAAV